MDPTRDETVGGRDSVPDGGAESDIPEDSLAALRSIYDVTTNKGLDFEEKIERLIAIGVAELDLPYGFLSEITVEDLGEEKGVQRISHAKGNRELLQPGETAPLTNAYCRKTIQSDGLLAIHNAQVAGWEDDPAYETFDLGSYIGEKVEVEEELYGTFCFASTEPRDRDFSEAEQTLVQILSRWASYELERERAKRTLETQRDNLEILSQVMRHDIRNNLQLVLAYAEMLEGTVEAEDAKYLDHIQESAREAVAITATAREVAEVMIQSDRDL